MGRVREVRRMGGLRPGHAAEPEFERLVETRPQNIGPEGNTGLGDEKMPHPFSAEVGHVGNIGQRQRLVEMRADPPYGPDRP